MADPKRDGYEPPVIDGSEPTTVRERLNTLPKNLKDHCSTLFFRDFRGSKWACKSLCDAISIAIGNCTELLPQEVRFLGGVQCFLWEYPEWELSEPMRLGYNAAKAAFEAACSNCGLKSCNCPEYYQLPENRVPFEIKPQDDEGDIPIGYIAIAPEDLAELRRKAAAYDAMLVKIQALEGAIEDFKALKP